MRGHIHSTGHTCPMVPRTVPTTFWYGRVTPAVPGLSQDSFTLVIRVSQTARVTPAVPGLSWDDYPTPGIPLAEYPRIPELHRQSRDCPGMATQPLCQNARVTPAVLGLSRDDYPTAGVTPAFGDTLTGLSRGVPGIVPGWVPKSSRDNPGTAGVTPVPFKV